MCEELVGLLTMLPGNWLVNDYVSGIRRGDAWRQYLYGLRKTCRPKSPADLPAESHSQIHSEPVFTCRLSFLTGRARRVRPRVGSHLSGLHLDFITVHVRAKNTHLPALLDPLATSITSRVVARTGWVLPSSELTDASSTYPNQIDRQP